MRPNETAYTSFVMDQAQVESHETTIAQRVDEAVEAEEAEEETLGITEEGVISSKPKVVKSNKV